MTVTAEELKEVLSKNPDVVRAAMASDPEFVRIVDAGKLAVARENARRLLEYARGRLAAKLATFDEAAAPILRAKEAADAQGRQILAQIEAATNDLANDRDASLPTKEQVDEAIRGYGE